MPIAAVGPTAPTMASASISSADPSASASTASSACSTESLIFPPSPARRRHNFSPSALAVGRQGSEGFRESLQPVPHLAPARCAARARRERHGASQEYDLCCTRPARSYRTHRGMPSPHSPPPALPPRSPAVVFYSFFYSPVLVYFPCNL